MAISPSVILAAVPYIALAVLVWFFFFQFYKNLGKWRKSGSDMVAPMSITLKTEKTPKQVQIEARAAARERFVRFMVVVIGGWLVLYLFNEELAILIADVFVSVVRELLAAMIQLLSLIVDQLPSQVNG